MQDDSDKTRLSFRAEFCGVKAERNAAEGSIFMESSDLNRSFESAFDLAQDDKKQRRPDGFTLVEVVAALALLTIMLSSVLVLMNRYVGAVIDMRLRQQAFELARSNMEILLSESKLSDIYEYGESETNPDIQWETIVEPFYEPYKNRMWIRAVCSAFFVDSKGDDQDVELEHWITNLTAAQIKQILAQQEVESEYMDLLQEGQYTDIQETTIYCLEQQSLDVEPYKDFLEQQRRQKLEYLDKNGMKGYDEFLEELEAEENEFLEYEIGMDFEVYNECTENYVPPVISGPNTKNPIINPPPPPPPPEDLDCIDCSKFPPEFIPLIESLGLKCC